MLTDTKLKSLKPTDKLYKVSDRDGLYSRINIIRHRLHAL
ncbi:integrase [Xenorhabdus innexi]|uniref:Integrase n=1 Tax=Xenorhabdus innexi TaxID=290109 RepID=A0A2G0N943_9GAMM|nr:integrase [Xenorhabdus innexi]